MLRRGAVSYRFGVAVPHAIRAMVLRRMRCMRREERAVILRAAAIGPCFDLQLLAATAPAAAGGVRAALERACDLQLIVAEDAALGRYRFRHAITRDIVYSELQKVCTGRLHRRIARALERRGVAASLGLEDVAYHFWAGGDAARALLYNELAGDNAAAIHAPDDALRYYERAQSLLAAGTPAYERLAAKMGTLGLARGTERT